MFIIIIIIISSSSSGGGGSSSSSSMIIIKFPRALRGNRLSSTTCLTRVFLQKRAGSRAGKQVSLVL